MIHFDPTINLGTIIAMAALVIPIIRLIRHLDRVEYKVNEMWSWFKKHSRVVIENNESN